MISQSCLHVLFSMMWWYTSVSQYNMSGKLFAVKQLLLQVREGWSLVKSGLHSCHFSDALCQSHPYRGDVRFLLVFNPGLNEIFQSKNGNMDMAFQTSPQDEMLIRIRNRWTPELGSASGSNSGTSPIFLWALSSTSSSSLLSRSTTSPEFQWTEQWLKELTPKLNSNKCPKLSFW